MERDSSGTGPEAHSGKAEVEEEEQGIILRYASGRRREVRVGRGATIAEVKAAVYEAGGTPVEAQRLYIGGREEEGEGESEWGRGSVEVEVVELELEGRTYLHEAANDGVVGAIMELLVEGADVNAVALARNYPW